MTMAILNIGYDGYVLPLKDAVAVAEILGKAEMYEHKYRSGGENTHHIYAEAKENFGTIRLITDAFYQGAKLAGKPE
jgi:hypothetical protein